MKGGAEWAIREGRCDEAEAVLELWRQAGATPSVTDTPEALRQAMSHADTWLLLAEAGSQLVGSIIGAFDGWRGNLYRLMVHPEYRRRGLGRALVAEAERRLLRAGAKQMMALVEWEHPWAVAFWEAAGFELDPRMVRYIRLLRRDGQ